MGVPRFSPTSALSSLTRFAGGVPTVTEDITARMAAGGPPAPWVGLPGVQARLCGPLVPEHASGRPRSLRSAVQRGAVLSRNVKVNSRSS